MLGKPATHLNEAIHLFNDSKAKSVLSVTKRNNKVAKYLIEEKSSLFGLMNDSAPFLKGRLRLAKCCRS